MWDGTWGYLDWVGLHKVRVLYGGPCYLWATFTSDTHTAAGVSILICWHSIFQEFARHMHTSGRALTVEYRSHPEEFLALVCYFPADEDADVVRSLLAWALSLLAPRQGVLTLLLEDLDGNPAWASGLRKASNSITTLWGDLLWDTGIFRCSPRVEVPTWTDGRGCVGVISGGEPLLRVLFG